MDLLIDLGNTRLKWAQSDAGVWVTGAALHRGRDLGDVIDDHWEHLSTPSRVVLVSVAAPDAQAALEYWIQDRWSDIQLHVVRPQHQQLEVTNGYRDPSTLGADRWAALLGARALTDKACAVVDCGTAVTVDVLQAEGVFAGGVIIPGLYLMQHSLDAGTAGIDVQHADKLSSDLSCLAKTTRDAVGAGALFGLAGAIERCLQEQEKALGDVLQVYLTGGDAPLFARQLRRTVIEIPDLVLKGLARIAEELA
jgi:type III pantothenate kinase